jgi:hypothetical protein
MRCPHPTYGQAVNWPAPAPFLCSAPRRASCRPPACHAVSHLVCPTPASCRRRAAAVHGPLHADTATIRAWAKACAPACEALRTHKPSRGRGRLRSARALQFALCRRRRRRGRRRSAALDPLHPLPHRPHCSARLPDLPESVICAPPSCPLLAGAARRGAATLARALPCAHDLPPGLTHGHLRA